MSISSEPGGGETHDFGARTPWSAGAAVAFALITLGLAIAVTYLAQPIVARIGPLLVGSSGNGGDSNSALASSMLAMILMQATLIALVLWGAGRFGGDRRRLLSLAPGLPVKALLLGLGGMLALLAPFNLAVYLVWPSEFASDLRPFWELARSPALWLASLVVTVGAPLSEELLFRGFLLPALTKTARGFTGAAVLTTVGWTGLHLGYSLIGLVEIMMIGAYYSWLMWRFQNLWLPIVLHAVYNGLQLLVLAVMPSF